MVRVGQPWNVPWPNSSAVGSIDVTVYSDLPVVELFLNGLSLGQRPCVASSYAMFPNVRYTPGNLTAVGRLVAGGPILASHVQLPSSTAVSIELSLDAPSALTGTGSALVLDGHDAGLVRATVRDAEGRLVTNANNFISFKVESGPGRVAGVHNGDATSHEPQVAVSRSAYHGLARAVIKVTVDTVSAPADKLRLLKQIQGGTGDGVTTVAIQPDQNTDQDIIVTASSPGLTQGKISIPVSSDPARHGVFASASKSTQKELFFN